VKVRTVNEPTVSEGRPEVSVVVCTYARPAMLQRCIRSLAAQTVSPSEYEIVIVDNALRGDAQRVVQSIRRTKPESRIVLVEEPHQGLSFARNTGAQVASGRYVAFVDDDAAASPEWLAAVMKVLQTICPRPTVVGGPIVPLYDAPKPKWFRDEYELRTWGPVSLLAPGGMLLGIKHGRGSSRT